MRPKSIVLLLLALGCGLVASIGISQVMENQKNRGGADEMLPILVAIADIGAMDKFSPENVKMEEWPKDKVRNGTLTSTAQLEGKHPRSKIFAGQPILESMLIGDHDAAGATESIPKGYVVCAVRVDAVSGSGSLIRPGDRVNVLVYLTRNPNLGIKDTRTQTILQDISVFAVDTMYVGSQSGDKEATSAAKTVSLLVTLGQAEKLTLASEMGSIRLVLRSAGDTVQVDSGGATPGGLFGTADAGNPDAEHNGEPKNDQTSQALLDLLGTAKQSTAPAPAVTTSAKAPGFKMTVVTGNLIKQVEFPADGSMPKELLDNSDPASGDAGADSSVTMPPLTGASGDPLSNDPLSGGAASSAVRPGPGN